MRVVAQRHVVLYVSAKHTSIQLASIIWDLGADCQYKYLLSEIILRIFALSKLVRLTTYLGS